MACRAPDGAGTRIATIGQAQLLQGEFEGLWRRAPQCFGPKRARCTAEQQAADVLGGARSFSELFEHGRQHRAHIDAIAAKVMGLVERAPPLIELEERSAGLQALRPRRGKTPQTLAVSGGVTEEPT